MNALFPNGSLYSAGSAPEGYLCIAAALAAVPLLISTATCYLKFSIVLGMLRSGFGTQQTPSSAMTMALSIVMSMIVMQPVVEKIGEEMQRVSVKDLSNANVSTLLQLGGRLFLPWREFLTRSSGERELEVFRGLAARHKGTALPQNGDGKEISDALPVVIGAFVMSEIRKGFLISFALLIPFFMVDLVVSNVLVGLGLTMMSPVIVSLPLKVLLFISSDGWLLLVQSLIRGYAE